MRLTRRPSTPSSDSGRPKDPVRLRWRPPCSRPEVAHDLDPELGRLLDTFWTAEPVWPASPVPDNGLEEGEAGPSTLLARPSGAPARTSRPQVTDDRELLALYRLLGALDPKEAARWHWRDGRKVRRALERWWERGTELIEYNDNDGSASTNESGRQAR